MATKQRVSFLGIGAMGLPMAKRLLASGYEVVAFNRSADKLEPLKAFTGAQVTTNPKEAIEKSSIICIMLAEITAVERVLFGDGADLKGRTIIQHSTISSEQTVQLAERIEAAGGRFVECPVLGSNVPAAEGKLLVMVGARLKADFEEIKPVLSCFGTPRYLGDIGHASVVKLAFNQLIISHTAGFALSLAMVEKAGVDTDVFMEMLRPSVAYAPYVDLKYKRMKEGKYEDPNFLTTLMLKDINLVISEAQRLGVHPGPIQGTQEVTKLATEKGLGEKDMSSIYEVVRGEKAKH